MIALHLATALAALVLGAAVLAARKGTRAHKRLGRAWLVLMLVVALSSFAIQTGGRLSVIHLLSAWTLIALACALYFIRRGNVRAHRGFMVGTFIGLVLAGLGALAPGRTLHALFFAQGAA
jgi:uncharacterized membrane protein